MSIRAKVMKALSNLGVEVCFLEREDDGKFPFIVYNISEAPLMFSDDEEEVTLYMVTINIFSKPDFNYESLKKEVVKRMKDAGFRKTKIPNAEFMEAENVYNQPMGFACYEIQ